MNRNACPVVKPEWILDCIQKNTLLPTAPYELDEMKDKRQQKLVLIKPQNLSKNENSEKSRDVNNEIVMEDDVYKTKNTLTDPDFLKNYLKSSRLHFIGAWKSKFHKKVQNVEKKSKMKLIAHIDMVNIFHIW